MRSRGQSRQGSVSSSASAVVTATGDEHRSTTEGGTRNEERDEDRGTGTGQRLVRLGRRRDRGRGRGEGADGGVSGWDGGESLGIWINRKIF